MRTVMDELTQNPEARSQDEKGKSDPPGNKSTKKRSQTNGGTPALNRHAAKYVAEIFKVVQTARRPRIPDFKEFEKRKVILLTLDRGGIVWVPRSVRGQPLATFFNSDGILSKNGRHRSIVDLDKDCP